MGNFIGRASESRVCERRKERGKGTERVSWALCPPSVLPPSPCPGHAGGGGGGWPGPPRRDVRHLPPRRRDDAPDGAVRATPWPLRGWHAHRPCSSRPAHGE